MCRLPVGHTHNVVDAFFSSTRSVYRIHNLHVPADFIKALKGIWNMPEEWKDSNSGPIYKNTKTDAEVYWLDQTLDWSYLDNAVPASFGLKKRYFIIILCHYSRRVTW